MISNIWLVLVEKESEEGDYGTDGEGVTESYEKQGIVTIGQLFVGTHFYGSR